MVRCASNRFPAGAWTAPFSGRAGRGRRCAGTNELVNLVGDALGRVAKLFHRPVGGVALGDVLRPGMVDQPLGEARRQHQVAVGDADEAVAKRVEPELRPAGLADVLFGTVE